MLIVIRNNLDAGVSAGNESLHVYTAILEDENNMFGPVSIGVS